MEIKDLTIKGEYKGDEKLEKRISNFQSYIDLLNSRDLDNDIIDAINSSIDELNNFEGSKRKFKLRLMKVRSQVVRHVEKQAKLVPQNYYRKLWLALGMSVFGMPIGVVFGTSFWLWALQLEQVWIKELSRKADSSILKSLHKLC
jgi:hypothetical protein